MKPTYRKLTESEIAKLEANGCLCSDWSFVEVKDGFCAEHIQSTTFLGNVKLGVFDKVISKKTGIKYHSGIYKASIQDCEIGDDVYIQNVSDCISNYKIGSNVFIQNVQTIATIGESSFGNGAPVAVLDETGSREIPIFDKLSSHIAYAYALYKYKPELIAKLEGIIEEYISKKISTQGIIEDDVLIENTNIINNVHICSNAVLQNVSRLTNGTIGCNAYVGQNVIAADFIFQSEAHISDAAKLTRCLVGQASKISSGFSAVDSVFFANSHLENGEACALFGGAYTVSHHKSTLLIGGLYSFMNAGSGSNQSNHMYKLGPIHYGVAERGAKLASDSYIAQPSKIGAFTMIMGRHYSHPDTSLFPFSYLIEKESKTYLAPAVNFATLGTLRDAQKFPMRDKRSADNRLESLSFSLLNPFICQKIIKALRILSDIIDTQADKDVYEYNNCSITISALAKGLKYYGLILDKYCGDTFIANFEQRNESSDCGIDEWIDFGGLIAPKKEIFDILHSSASVDAMNLSFAQLLPNTKQMEWNWVKSIIKDTDCKETLTKWLAASDELNELTLKDAAKEFSDCFKVAFGIDGDEESKINEFESVRGKVENNKFVLDIRNQMEMNKKTFNRLMVEL